MSRSLLAFAASFTLLVTSCVSKDSERTDRKYSEVEEKQIIKVKKEVEIGRNMAGRLLRYWGTVDAPKVTRYINQLGAYVAQNSEYRDRKFMFEILDTPVINAFAAPGGYILITRGTLENAANEAELAAVIAHEIAHIGKEHMLSTLVKIDQDERNKENTKSKLPKSVEVRKRPDPKVSAIGSQLAKYISGSVAGLNVLKAATAGMGIILEKGLDAQLEFDADRVGNEILVNAGYYPYALVDFLCRIEIKRGGKKEDCFTGKTMDAKQKKSILDKTHPSVPMRIAAAMKDLEALGAKDITGAQGKKRFKKKTKDMFMKTLSRKD
ncbi:MAG: M48 family metalloprotease [Pseudobacteriovorax sp.]|nr:M48 family metalloprotease [Pseudobacteriovorax sp.]